MPNAILMLGASMESVSAEEGILATAFRAKEVGLCFLMKMTSLSSLIDEH